MGGAGIGDSVNGVGTVVTTIGAFDCPAGAGVGGFVGRNVNGIGGFVGAGIGEFVGIAVSASVGLSDLVIGCCDGSLVLGRIDGVSVGTGFVGDPVGLGVMVGDGVIVGKEDGDGVTGAPRSLLPLVNVTPRTTATIAITHNPPTARFVLLRFATLSRRSLRSMSLSRNGSV